MKVQSAMETKLKDAFRPLFLEVINESGNHNVPPGSESHFKVLLVSGSFDGKMPVARHRMVNKALADELNGGVHALTMKLMTPAQWEAAGRKIESESPPCAGGH